MQRDLILQARAGDHAAFTELAAAAFDRIHRTARLILRDDDLAADAVQDALVSAWLHIRAIRDPDRFDIYTLDRRDLAIVRPRHVDAFEVLPSV